MPVNYNKPPPFERDNWHRMNEGQRRYAMEQYNLALVRRGQRFEPPIAHRRSPSPVQDVPVNENNPINDLDDLDRLLDQVNDLIGAPETADPVENPPVNNSTNMDVDPLPSTSAGGGIKRAHEGADSTTPMKKQVTGHSSSALPGTSGNTDGMVGGGSARAIDTSRGVMSISRGIHIEKFTWTFKKKWKFLSFGVADVILTDIVRPAQTDPAVPELSRRALTTSLVNIPWEYAFFYMSPAEYSRLIQMTGVFATHCKMRVFQYNPRVAFQTADTTSTQATLNQNKFTRIAIGLREREALWGSDRDYVFDTTEPMKPTGIENNGPKFRESLTEAMYGSANSSPAVSALPGAIVTGQELALHRYYTAYTDDTHDIGWPQYNKFCSEFNSMDLIGKEVVNVSHKFKYAPLSARARNYHQQTLIYGDAIPAGTAIPDMLQFSDGTSAHDQFITYYPSTGLNNPDPNQHKEQFSCNKANTQLSGKDGETLSEIWKSMYTKKPMEQGGVYTEANMGKQHFGNHSSVHVGVRAVPKLGSLGQNFVANSWLDCQMYWTVECELQCVSSEPFVYPRGNVADTLAGSILINDAGTNGSRQPVSHTYDRPFFLGRPQTTEDSITY